ncbi:MAG: ABC transporter transmembrane domain-containing protein [bacterium]|nr:ABC transporter transmembrane domain-containing protein [bacterium]
MANSSTNGTPTLEPVPQDILSELADHISEADLRLSIDTDLRLDGTFGSSWLLATDQHLIAFSPNDPPDIVKTPLDQINRVEIQDFPGASALKIRTSTEGTTVARFSKSLHTKFDSIPDQLADLIREARPSDDNGKIVKGHLAKRGTQKRCDSCGTVIPHWMGVCPACLDTRKLLTRLLSYGLPHWKLATLSLILLLTATFISLTPPLLMRSLIDDVLIPTTNSQLTSESTWLSSITGLLSLPQNNSTYLSILVVILLLINLSQNGLRALRTYILSIIGQKVTFDLRNEVYQHLHRHSLSFYNERETGRIMASITHDVGRLQDFISDGLQEIIRNIFTLLIICIILFTLNAKLTLLVLLPTPLLVITTLQFGERLHKIYRRLWRRYSGISALLADTIPGVRVVKAFAQEHREVEKFKVRSYDLLEGEIRVAGVRSIFSPIMGFITSLGTLIVWWLGGHAVLDNTLTLGDFVAFTSYMWRFYGPVESLCRLNHRFQRAGTSAERVFEVLDIQPDIVDRSAAVTMPPIEGEVRFENVTFSYEPGKPVIQNLTCTIEPGEMIGLAGHSGAGKSTLINLICRFYDVQEGAVLIDGHDIRDVTLKSLRNQIGVVLQDPFLFNSPIADNIAYGKPDASLEEIIGAAKAANAHDFILKLPDSYDTPVGERGVRLSGGERQRISIARAILRNPRILILDEATSSMDTETESQIQEALHRLIQGRTTFAIAHRLSTLKHANRLLILENGELAEIGTHDELIAQDGIYARLCRMQTELSKLRVW